jgi:hypothetical protein
MKKYILIIGSLLTATLLWAASPTQCPFVDTKSGLKCIGVPIPDGVSVAGSLWKCSANGQHKWVTK